MALTDQLNRAADTDAQREALYALRSRLERLITDTERTRDAGRHRWRSPGRELDKLFGAYAGLARDMKVVTDLAAMQSELIAGQHPIKQVRSFEMQHAADGHITGVRETSRVSIEPAVVL